MEQNTFLAMLFSAAALTAQNTSAAVITPVGGSTGSFIGAGSIANVIDGVIDFDSFLGLGPQTNGAFTGPFSVTFDLGGRYDITSTNLWNNAGFIEFDGEGMNAFQLRFLDSGSALLNDFTGNAVDTLAQQSFAINAMNVAFVNLVINSNHAPTFRQYADFHEINFVGVPAVPELSQGVLLLAGLAAVLGHRKASKA